MPHHKRFSINKQKLKLYQDVLGHVSVSDQQEKKCKMPEKFVSERGIMVTWYDEFQRVVELGSLAIGAGVQNFKIKGHQCLKILRKKSNKPCSPAFNTMKIMK